MGFVFLLTDEECERGSFTLEYNSVTDRYFRNGIEETRTEGWKDRLFSSTNLQRKIERDWKMVYLSRQTSSTKGILSWRFVLDTNLGNTYRIHRISVQCPTKTFDPSAQIHCQLQFGNGFHRDLPSGLFLLFLPSLCCSIPRVDLDLSSPCECFLDDDLTGASLSPITFQVTLATDNDSTDDNAWQKAQLFRQSIDRSSSEDHSHYFRIHFDVNRRTSSPL